MHPTTRIFSTRSVKFQAGTKSHAEQTLRKDLELHWTEDKPVVWQVYNLGKKALAMRFGQNKAEEIQFVSVDKLFFGKQIPVEECMEDKFFEEIEMIDFEKDPIANGAYFKSTWQSMFKPEETKKEIFHISNERQDFVDIMHVEGTFNHAANEKLGCHIPKLLYTGQDEGFRELIIEKTVDMKTVLGQLSMGKLFENSANFSDFSKKAQIGFDEVLQQSKIVVNEASATVASSFRSSRPTDPAMFHCNHPFIFVIYDNATQAVLFNVLFFKCRKLPFHT
ncbi:hypothetical protein quinque_013540 [Culex quinquefasciatus]